MVKTLHTYSEYDIYLYMYIYVCMYTYTVEIINFEFSSGSFYLCGSVCSVL
jgi:hypothetical protein